MSGRRYGYSTLQRGFPKSYGLFDVPMDKEEVALRARLSKNTERLERKISRLTSLISTLSQSIEKLQNDATDSLDRIQLQKNAQIKKIRDKYDRLETELMNSTDTIVAELDYFIEDTVKDLRGRIITAKDCLVHSLKDEKSLLRQADTIENSLQRILNTRLPDLDLSPLLELRCTGVEHREIELDLVESKKTPIPLTRYDDTHSTSRDTQPPGRSRAQPSTQSSRRDSSSSSRPARASSSTPRPEKADHRKLDCRGDFYEQDIGDAATVSETDATANVIEDTLASHHDPVPPQQTQSYSSVESPRAQLVSFSASISQAQIPGFSSHIAHAGTNAFIVDSFGPSIYKINERYDVRRLISVDRSRAVVGLAASVDYLYVQYMDVTEYHRAIFVYTTEDGRFVKKWDSPNLLGSSIALVHGHLFISSRDKVMVCSPTGKHVKDIPLTPTCVKTLCTLPPDSVVLCSTSNNLLMKLNVETEEVCWRNYTIESPVCATADSSGRVYVLVQPSIICMLDGTSGELMMRSTLSCPGGLMEGLCVTDQGLLLASISYRGNKNAKPSCYSVLNAFRIEAAC